MATVRDLRKSISRMSYEDALKIIVKRRNSRRVAKAKRAKSGGKKAKQPTVIDPFAIVGKLNKAQKEALRKELLGE